MNRLPFLAPALASVLALTACEVGPNFHRPAAPADTSYARTPIQAGNQHLVAGRDIPGEWWQLFHSPPLDRLVKNAVAANPDLDAARAALREARENLRAGQGALFPTVGASVQPGRELLSGAEEGVPQEHPTFSLVTSSLNVSYAVDVFGGTRRQIESLGAQVDYERFELEAAYLTLTSNVIVAAIQEASLRGQIAATRDIIADQQHELDLVRSRFGLGAASRADVLTQEAQLAQTKATLPPLEQQLAQTRDQLTALAGRMPSNEIGETFDLAALSLPMELPVTIPSKLIDQRPDIRAAEAQLHAASAQIGVATAAQLPQFNITASAGYASTGITNMFDPAFGTWSILGGVSQSLFDAGTLLHKKRAAVAAFDQIAAQYRGTVIKAAQNVADALHALQSDADALAAQNAAERSAFASLDLSRRQYALGAIDYLTLLNAQRTWQQARINLVQAQAARYSDTAALFQALGGGWWNRSDVPDNSSTRNSHTD